MKIAKALRLETGTTGTAMAAAVGATQPGYSAWENGKGPMAEHRREGVLAILRDTFDYPGLTLEDLDAEATMNRLAKVKRGRARR